jgi:adenylate kinase family enzyme
MPKVNRISVVGSSGSGKTTLARAIAGALGAPSLELDSVYHQANWTPLPDSEFVARVRRFVEQPRWVAMRTELWNGNRECWRNLWSTDPEQNIVLWAFTRFQHTRARYETRTRDPRFAHLAVHRLRTEAEGDGLLSVLGA